MESHFQEWLSFILRWIHLITGISWIGSSFYFMWLDASLTEPEHPRKEVEGELWMVHSGGFYRVEKRKIGPGQMPRVLHWFKWEALFTWVTGIFLLCVIYYMTGGVYLLDAGVSHVTPAQASGLGIGLLIVSWFLYDALWKSSFGKSKPTIATAICYITLIGIVYGLCHVLSGRAAYIHVGAMLGTIMVMNVWVRILPAQQKMIDATAEGRIPDYNLGKAAKRRSVHNSYMTFPVLFIMLSNHYSMTYSNSLNWIVLLLLIVLGAGTRHAMIAKERSGYWALGPAAIALAAVIFMTSPVSKGIASLSSAEATVHFSQAQAVISRRCITCHSQNPTDEIFRVAPSGVLLDTPERIKSLAERIKARAVVLKTMPLGNKSGMTDEERALLGMWIDQGARIE